MSTSILTRVDERNGPWCEAGATGYSRIIRKSEERTSLEDEDVLQSLQILDDVLAECDSEIEDDDDVNILNPVHSVSAPCTPAKPEHPFSFDTIRNRVPPPSPDEAAKIVASLFPKNIPLGALARSSDSEEERPPSPPKRSTSLKEKPIFPDKMMKDCETITEFRSTRIEEAMYMRKKKPPPPIPKRNPSTRLSSRSSSSSVDSPSPTYKSWNANVDESPPTTMRNTQSWSGRLLTSPSSDLPSPSSLVSPKGIPKSSTLSTFKPFNVTPTERQSPSSLPWSSADNRTTIAVVSTAGGQSQNDLAKVDKINRKNSKEEINKILRKSSKEEVNKITPILQQAKSAKSEPYIPPPDYDSFEEDPPPFKPEPPTPKSPLTDGNGSRNIAISDQKTQGIRKNSSPEIKIKYQDNQGRHVTCISIGESVSNDSNNITSGENVSRKEDNVVSCTKSVNSQSVNLSMPKDYVPHVLSNCVPVYQVHGSIDSISESKEKNMNFTLPSGQNDNLNRLSMSTSMDNFNVYKENVSVSNKTVYLLSREDASTMKEGLTSKETVILRNNPKENRDKMPTYRNSMHEIKEHVNIYRNSVNNSNYNNSKENMCIHRNNIQESRDKKQLFRKSMHELRENALVTKEFDYLLLQGKDVSEDSMSPTKEHLHRYKNSSREFVQAGKNVYDIKEMDNMDEFEEPPNFKPPPPPFKKKAPIELPQRQEVNGIGPIDQTKGKAPLVPPCKKRMSMNSQVVRPTEPPPAQPLTRSKSLQLQLKNIAEPVVLYSNFENNECAENYPRNGFVSANVAAISQHFKMNSMEHLKNGDKDLTKNGFNQNGFKPTIPKSKSITFNNFTGSTISETSANSHIASSSVKSNGPVRSSSKKMNSAPSLPSLIKSWCHSSSGDSSPPSPPSPTFDNRPPFPSANNQLMEVKLRPSPSKKSKGDGNQHSALVAEIQSVMLKRNSTVHLDSEKQENSYL